MSQQTELERRPCGCLYSITVGTDGATLLSPCIMHADGARYVRLWAEAIAADMRSGRCPDGIVAHIRKHATEDLDKHVVEGGAPEGMTRWAASMRNLLAIFEAFYHVHPTALDQVARLEDQYIRKPDVRTPPPRLTPLEASGQEVYDDWEDEARL